MKEQLRTPKSNTTPDRGGYIDADTVTRSEKTLCLKLVLGKDNGAHNSATLCEYLGW